jgi:DNA-binding response OmpR family regulator
MAVSATLLCIHRDPDHLRLLKEQGYGLITATNGSDGLRLLMSHPVDAVVLECHLGLLDGVVVADEIKQVRPLLPILMVADDLELPDGTLKSVDAIVTKADGPHFLWAAIHFLVNIKPYRSLGGKNHVRARQHSFGETQNRRTAKQSQVPALEDDTKSPFSADVWKSIRKGIVQF